MEVEEAKKVMDSITAMSLNENPVFTVNVDYSLLNNILRAL